MLAATTSTIDPGFADLAGAGSRVGSRYTTGNLKTQEHLRSQAEGFEASFLSTMFQSMFTSIEGDGPLGQGAGVTPWRSFLTQEYANNFVKAGGIGLSDDIYRSLLAQQEARSK
jgi:peptidoglycan hydrolase FlgJ